MASSLSVPLSHLSLFTNMHLQEVVIPDSSLAQSEEEQLHPLSKRQKMRSVERGDASLAVKKVSDYCSLNAVRSHSCAPQSSCLLHLR